MKCPECANELAKDTRDVAYTYKGEQVIIAKVTALFCTHCDEYLTDPSESRRVMAAMRELRLKVNADAVKPEFVSTIRQKLNLNQQEAGRIFGGGVNAFSRYETGKTQPPLALVKLLKLLDNHPDLLAEIR